jgi:hypothetical protein
MPRLNEVNNSQDHMIREKWVYRVTSDIFCYELIDLHPDKSGLDPKLIDPEKSGPPLSCGLWPQDKAIPNGRDGRLLGEV